MKNIIQSSTRFLSEVRVELARIEWPKFHEFVGATLVVLVVVLFFAVYLGAVDRIITTIAKYVFSRGIFG
ncbi:MAG: preprotein translocase subunit SecE [Candidatus Dependentiae bacterium]|nr:preprotein translocase subunit SecE [Candidatus Dependentiae bacterium]